MDGTSNLMSSICAENVSHVHQADSCVELFTKTSSDVFVVYHMVNTRSVAEDFSETELWSAVNKTLLTIANEQATIDGNCT